ncbi:MAG: glutamate--tRNA ligase [Gammaproteobacteria bacterium]
MIKTRFCPSPTGLLHLGNARTALFNALASQHADGTFLLRIEDTDAERSKHEYVDALLRDLQWLGIQWQEGADVGGDAGPYFQSQRQAVYDQYYEQLIEKDLAFHCFCTEEELALQRTLQRKLGKPPRYPGTCRHLSSEEIEKKRAQGLQPTLRFKVPKDKKIVFEDLVRGNQIFDSNDLSDFIIRRADGTASFMYCNAVDDALMGVTMALRGEDHLTNTPRQLLITEALGLKSPQYGHISLIVAQDGSPLSKRHGSRSLDDLNHDGYLPKAVLNYLARLGHTYMDHNDLMSLDDCAKYFDTNYLVKAPAKFDPQQLLYWQKEAVLALTQSELALWLNENTLALVPDAKKAVFIETVQPNILFPKEAHDWAELLFTDHISYDEPAIEILKSAGDAYFDVVANAEVDDLKALFDHLKSMLNVKGKALFQPFRVALTGMLHGPELAPLYELMGEERVKLRFKKVLEQISCW